VRILITPCVTHKTWATESEISQFRRFARSIHESAGVTSYMVIPADMTDIKKVKPEPGLFYLPLGKWKKFHVAMGEIQPGLLDWVNIGKPKLYVDAVLTTRTGAAGYLQRMLWDGKGSYLPVWIQESMVADYSTPMVKGIGDIDLQSRAFAYSTCKTIVETEHEKRVAMKMCRRYLNASACKRIKNDMMVFPHGLPFDILKKVRAKKKTQRKHAVFTVFFGGRLNAAKRAKQLIETYDKFFAAGRKIRIIITSPLPTLPMEVPKEIEIYPTLNTEQFLEKCVRSHVLLSSSRIEGFSIGLHEQMATGIVTILPKFPWAQAMMKEKWSDYPFKYGTFQEAYGWMKWIYENYEEAKAKVSWVPQWMEKNASEQKCSIDIFNAMERQCREMWPPKKFGNPEVPSGNAQMVDLHIDRMPKMFHLADLMHSIATSDDNQYREDIWFLGARGKVTAWQLYSYLTFHPKIKDVGGRQPRYEKVKGGKKNGSKRGL